MERFLGKTVIITGSGRGIGKEIALRFAKEKANVVLTSNESLVHDTCKDFKDIGYEASSIEGDVSDKQSVIDIFDFAEKQYGEVNIPFLFRRLDELGYDAWVGCEYSPKGDSWEGLSWAVPYGFNMDP